MGRREAAFLFGGSDLQVLADSSAPRRSGLEPQYAYDIFTTMHRLTIVQMSSQLRQCRHLSVSWAKKGWWYAK